MSTPLTEAAEDYLYSFRLLCEFADYIVLNVRSPNTPGLRELQGADALSELHSALGEGYLMYRIPIVVKHEQCIVQSELVYILSPSESQKVVSSRATPSCT